MSCEMVRGSVCDLCGFTHSLGCLRNSVVTCQTMVAMEIKAS